MYTSYLAKKKLNIIHLLLRSQAGVDIVFALCHKNQHRSSRFIFQSFIKCENNLCLICPLLYFAMTLLVAGTAKSFGMTVWGMTRRPVSKGSRCEHVDKYM